MIKNYLKIAFRQLLKNKSFSAINILGLAIGMGSVILIALWMQNELSYDNFHKKRERIYELWNRAEYSGNLECWNTTPMVAAKTLPHDIPEIEKMARVNWSGDWLFDTGTKQLHLKGNVVDKEFLDVFSFPLLQGDPKTALANGTCIVLTEKAARKLFGHTDVIGKALRVDNKENLVVTAIISDPPDNTRFDFEYLIGWQYLLVGGKEDERWGNNNMRNYVLLRENASFETAQSKVKNIRQKYQDKEDAFEMFLYPMDRWRLYSRFEEGVEVGGRVEYVRLFGIIAGFILVIACINFINLSTARSEKRAREVGIRKTVGARRNSLILQFISESVILVFIGFAMALLLVQLSLPAFNELTDKHLHVDYSNIYYWFSGICFILFTGLLAGFYPAFFLSSFQPVKVLKGTFRNIDSLITPRKTLVVFQFTFAIILIICTIIVRQQIHFVQQRETGYNKDNLIYHQLSEDLEKNYPALKHELISTGIASSVCKTSSPLTQGWSDTWGIIWQGRPENDKTDFDRFCTDEDFVKTAGLQLIKGRDFNLSKFPSDSSGVILNESALKIMGFKEPIGQIIEDSDRQFHVIGVIRDFILHSPYHPTKPIVIEGCSKHWLNIIHVKLNPANLTSYNIEHAEALFKKYNPGVPFQYKFINEEYEQKFENEQRTAALASLFAALTIFISCLGLFGLATYTAENRVKEIGIRKVLGASVMHIASLLSLNFLKLVAVALLIATPCAWWCMNAWLADYPFHVAIKWWVFVVAGLSSMLIAVFTISSQAIKAAMSNPVKSLRTE